MRFLASAAFVAALAWGGSAMAQGGPTPGACNQALCSFPTGHGAGSGAGSQSQLAKQLRQEGYGGIQITAYEPNWANPRPVLIPPPSDSAQVPVHKG